MASFKKITNPPKTRRIKLAKNHLHYTELDQTKYFYNKGVKVQRFTQIKTVANI